MIFIASDKPGFFLKEEIKKWCQEWSLQVVDLGPKTLDQEVDWQDLAEKINQEITGNYDSAVAIVVSKDGIIPSVLLNRFDKIRCGLISVSAQAKKARESFDINALSLASDYTSFKRAKKIVSSFFQTETKLK